MADALASGASALRGVEVQLLSRAQRSQAGDGKASVTGFSIPELTCGRPVTSTGYEAALMTPADGVCPHPVSARDTVRCTGGCTVTLLVVPPMPAKESHEEGASPGSRHHMCCHPHDHICFPSSRSRFPHSFSSHTVVHPPHRPCGNRRRDERHRSHRRGADRPRPSRPRPPSQGGIPSFHEAAPPDQRGQGPPGVRTQVTVLGARPKVPQPARVPSGNRRILEESMES